MTTTDNHWRICNACKKSIPFLATHYVCSVSTCTRKRTGMVFCSVSCWETHVPVLRHRDAWAIETKAPSKTQWELELAEEEENKPAPKPLAQGSAIDSPSLGSRAAVAMSPASGVKQAPPPSSLSSMSSASTARPAARIVGVTSTPYTSSNTSSASNTFNQSGGAEPTLSDDVPEEILIVVSKLKAYVRARSGMNTSDGVIDRLSDIVRRLCDDAIREAGRAERKTVMDRDFK